MDFNEFYLAIAGFGGGVAQEIRKKLLVNKAVSVNAGGGNISMEQADLQMIGRLDWLKELWSAIHFFGCAVDTNADRIGNAPSGVSLEFQYSLLDLKADLMITEAALALENHYWFVTEDINRQEKTKYSCDLVSVTFNKSRITNRLETVTMIMQSENFVPERILLQAHPLVEDADQAYKDLLEQRKRKLKEQREQFGSFGSTDPASEGDQ
jgi:SPP1 family phage portal protein